MLLLVLLWIYSEQYNKYAQDLLREELGEIPNVYVKRRNGYYAEIDRLYVLPQGIVAVYEPKTGKGEISGAEGRASWIVFSVILDRKNHFPSPLTINNSNIYALKEVLRGINPDTRYFSVVMFRQGNIIKSMKLNAKKDDITQYVIETRNLAKTLRNIMKNHGTVLNNSEVYGLRDYFKSLSKQNDGVHCPICGASLTPFQKNRMTPKYLHCANFPNCKYSRLE